jgi:hypothetical protein
MFCKSLNCTPNEDFADCIDILFDSPTQKNSEKDEIKKDTISHFSSLPRILFSYYYSHSDSATKLENNLNKDIIPKNLYLVSGSNAKLDFDFHCSQVGSSS